MASRGQTLTVTYTAWDTTNQVGKTGDVGSHILRWIKDGTSAAPTNTPTEVDATNAKGEYKLTLTAGECTCNFGTLAGVSSTSGVVILPVKLTFEQLPTAVAGQATGLPLIESGMTLVDGAITDATITLPTETTGTPSTALQLLMWVAGWFGWRKVVKDDSTMTQYMANSSTAKTTSTYTSVSGTDTINKAS